LKHANSPFDRFLFLSVGLNVACCLAASQSEHRLDAPFALAEVLQVSGYAVLLGGALLDNIRLFDSVRHLSVSAPLTGLANYRRLIDALESEIQRSHRTGRSFCVLLFDLNGLKQLNDSYGHIAGSKALCRVANVLRTNSREVDTAARYGGDEFAVLEHCGTSEGVGREGVPTSMTVSVGAASYWKDAKTPESLFIFADKALYRAKGNTVLKLSTAR
jgi:GGDEF domain-containing protein